MDQWIAALDDLLSRPFGTDDDGGPEPHHVDLRESQDFWDDQTRDEVFKPILAEVGHYDKELSLQLMLVVGELGSHRPGTGR